jgi:hypothetical protein
MTASLLETPREYLIDAHQLPDNSRIDDAMIAARPDTTARAAPSLDRTP